MKVEVQESLPTEENNPIFLSPPPEFLFTKDPAFLALDAALYKVIYIMVKEEVFAKRYKYNTPNNITKHDNDHNQNIKNYFQFG